MENDAVPRSGESLNASNDGFTNAGVIQLRLDTAPMLDSIEAFLRGRKIIGYRDTLGGVEPVYGSVGVAKANELGVQSIMSWLTPMFSPHTVQGYLKDRQELNEFLCYIQKGLAKYLMSNREEWAIKRQDYSGIIRGIMVTAEPFFTRLLENKERESYMQTMRVTENNNFGKERGNGFFGGLFGRRQ